jgi:hypothetical protein
MTLLEIARQIIGYILVIGGAGFVIFNFTVHFAIPFIEYIKTRTVLDRGSAVGFLGTISMCLGWALAHPIPKWFVMMVMALIFIDILAAYILVMIRWTLDKVAERRRP